MPRYLSFPPRLLERRTMRVLVVVQLLGASGLAAAASWLLVLAAAFRPTFTANTASTSARCRRSETSPELQTMPAPATPLG